MCSKARCLAALAGRLPDAYTVDVAFKLLALAPAPLPSTVTFSAVLCPDNPGWIFGLYAVSCGSGSTRNRSLGRPHLAGSIDATLGPLMAA